MANDNPAQPSENDPLDAAGSTTESTRLNGDSNPTLSDEKQGSMRALRPFRDRWRTHLTIAGIGAVLLVLNHFIDFVGKTRDLLSHYWSSETSITMMNASDDTIFVNVSNTGGKPSTLLEYRLNFGTLPVENRTLRPVDEDRSKAVIPPGATVPIRLTVLGLRTRVRSDTEPERFTKAEIDQLMNGQEVTLEIDIRESNDPRPGHLWNLIKPRKIHTAVDTFAVERIHEFVIYWLPDHDVH